MPTFLLVFLRKYWLRGILIAVVGIGVTYAINKYLDMTEKVGALTEEVKRVSSENKKLIDLRAIDNSTQLEERKRQVETGDKLKAAKAKSVEAITRSHQSEALLHDRTPCKNEACEWGKQTDREFHDRISTVTDGMWDAVGVAGGNRRDPAK